MKRKRENFCFLWIIEAEDFGIFRTNFMTENIIENENWYWEKPQQCFTTIGFIPLDFGKSSLFCRRKSTSIGIQLAAFFLHGLHSIA